jgi:glyoxylase-like metal-dependent hydrolase (beta-lactamase superfamily II)
MLAAAAAAAVAAGLAGATQAQAPAPAAQPQGQQPMFDVIKVDEGVYRFRYGGHNSMFIVTPAGVIVTDPISLRRPEAAQAYMAEIRKITSAPIRYMIYSHTHYDHATGGKPFKDAGAVVIAHDNAKARLMKVSNPDIVMPDQTVKERRTITLGGETVQLIYLGRNHSDNMLVMLLPKRKILYTVDWVPVGGPPGAAGFTGDTYLPEWRDGLRKVLAMDWDRMIPGHGARLGTKADVQMLIDWMGDAEAQAKTLADSGRCTPEGRAAVAVPAKYQGYAQPAQWAVALDRYCTFHNQGY